MVLLLWRTLTEHSLKGRMGKFSSRRGTAHIIEPMKMPPEENSQLNLKPCQVPERERPFKFEPVK